MIIKRIAQILKDHGIEYTMNTNSITAYEVVGSDRGFTKEPIQFDTTTTVNQLKCWLGY